MGLQEGALDKEKPLANPIIPVKVAAGVKNGPPLSAMSPLYNLIRSGSTHEEDSDGEEMTLCQKCNLPLGDIVYGCMHGECMAQIMVQDMLNEEKKRLVGER